MGGGEVPKMQGPEARGCFRGNQVSLDAIWGTATAGALAEEDLGCRSSQCGHPLGCVTPTPRGKSPHPTLQEYIHFATSHLHPLMQIIQRVISAAQNSRVKFCITWFCIWHSTELHPFSCSRFVRLWWGEGKQSSPHGKEKDAGGQTQASKLKRV